MKYEIEIPFAPYNSRRFGTPWAAVLTWRPDTLKPDYAFCGRYDRKTGVLSILASVGEVIAYGQKDMRGGLTLHPQIEIIGSDGSRTPATESIARKAWLARQNGESSK